MNLTTLFGAVASTIILCGMTIVGVQAKQEHTAMLDREQMECLALNVYFEARGESKLGQRAVAWVTMNRVNDPQYPSTICNVVWQSKQFSWTHDGKQDVPTDEQAWLYANYVAAMVMSNHGRIPDPTDGAVMFHSVTSNPYWTDYYDRSVRIDDHIFYRRDS